MNPIERAFSHKPPFVGFIVAGDGGADYSIACGLQLIRGGVDILEIGFPFSDPVADGPTIQKAAERSLRQGATHSTLLEVARGIRKESSTPLLLFGYYNPLLQRGPAYLRALKEAGFDAILIIDLPPPDPYFDAVRAADVVPIFVVTPSTSERRLAALTKSAQGFIYYACQKGTTGIRDKLPDDLSFHLSRIREKTTLPIVVGFGIADQKSAASVLTIADGFVVGSAIVRLMEEGASPEALCSLATSIGVHP